MSEQQAAQGFGPNMPTRISASAELILEPGDVAPSLPWYQPLVPFFGSQVVSGGAPAAGGTSSDSGEWKSYPDRLDLSFYQGDDVQIPLYFQDSRDMSADEWQADVRFVHRYASTLIYEFSVSTEFVPAGVDTPARTLVTLFLPRQLNKYFGHFQWELASTSPYTGPTFPVPAGVDAAEWPPTDQVKTWLYGELSVVPRLTDTDVLTTAGDSTFVPIGPVAAGVSPAGFVVGPNGRVP